MQVVIAYVGVILIWSTTPLGINFSVSDGSVLLPLILRMVIGLLLSFIYLVFVNDRLQFNKPALLTYFSSVIGVCGAMLVTYWGAQYIPSGLISVLFGLSPIVAGVLAIPLLKQPFFSIKQLIAIGLSISGLAIIFIDELRVGDEGWKGIVAIVIAVCLYALSTVLIKKFNAQVSAVAINAGSLLFSMPLFALIWLIASLDSSLASTMQLSVISNKALYAIIYLGFFGSFIGFVCYFYILKHLSATSVLLIPLITPVLALLLGNIVNNEIISLHTILGAALVLFGLGLYQLTLHHLKQLIKQPIKHFAYLFRF